MMLLPAHLHRWHSAAWVAGVTLVVSTMLPQPASAAAGQEVRLTGEVIVTQVDPLPGSPEVPESISLRTPDREIATTGLTAALAGKTVTVTGQLRAGILAVTNIESVRPTGSTNGLGIAGVTTYRPRTIRTAYVLTRFASDPAPDYTLADARSRLFGATNSVAAYFREATDGGIVLTGDVLGWYTVTTTDTCDWQTWTAQAQAAAIAAGVNMSQYQEIVTAGPFRLSCPFAGIGNVGTSGAYINGGPSLVVVAHEMGHNFGLHHASTLRCTKNGVTVVLSDACTRAEYGDPYSAMGSSGRLFPARQAYQVAQHMNGALPSGAVVTATTGTYTVARRHSGRTPQLLRVPRGSTGTSFDLELRATSGTFDTFASGSNPVSGVQIRISPNAIDDIAQTKLLDATPATELFDDGAFTPGTSLVDASSGVSIRVTAVTSTSATIIVESATDTSAPSAPGNLAGTATQSGAVLRWTAATDNVGIVSYQVAQDGQLLGTVTGTTFTTTGATPNTDHSYLAWARDRAGNPGPAATLTVHTLPDTTPPSGVGKLIATTTSTTIIVSWTRATDNGVLYGYEALIDGQPRWVTLAQCCSLTIQGLAPASSHTFSVTAIDIGGNRGTSSTLTARTKTASGR